MLAALPGLAGALGETLPVGELISVGGQGLLLCALAQEHGIIDRDDQVELLGAVLLGRELVGSGGRAQRRRAQEEAGILVPELADPSAPPASPGLATGAALARMGRTLSSLQHDLSGRPQRRGERRFGVIPVIGALGDYRDEREGLHLVAEQGLTWCRLRAAAVGPSIKPTPGARLAHMPDPVAVPEQDAVTVPLQLHDPAKGAGMEPVIATKVKDKHAAAWLAALAPQLYPGEAVTALSKTALLRPNCDVLAVTNSRVLALNRYELDKGAKREVLAEDIARVDVMKKTFGANTLVVTTHAGEELSFGDVPAADQEMVLGIVRHLGLVGGAPDARRAIAHQHETDRRGRTAWDAVEVIGTAPNEKAWKALKDHCSPDEVPWFVVGAGTAGVLAAFTDRAMVVKVGGMTSMMAGSLGGGRVTTFPYSEITGIEYNAGIVTGVLELLTPSYSGTANRDYWRGTRASRNADAGDPWTLSNTVPMPRDLYQRALPRLNEMRARIAEIKRPMMIVTPPAAAAPPSSVAAGPAGSPRNSASWLPFATKGC
ncbi:hypothetical protein [Actinomycetospora sp. CA-053990]|uniref:hypothetical protein n=1 Tax=Actinomycetospora sp. CA-053990 TaxID=3239891 RepID=UPI003D8FC905